MISRMPFDILLPLALTILSGCAHVVSTPSVPVALYEKVAEAFVMVTREDDAENVEITWSQASGCAVEEDGRHYLYTARHVVFDETNNDALPEKLFATTLDGESYVIDLSTLEVPDDNHDAVRIELPQPICRELHLARRSPKYGDRIFVFGDAGGAGVMCAEAGTVIALGPLEFEHTADSIGGMSGGPVVDSDGDVIGLCQKGRKTTAHKNGIAVESDSRYLRLRNFAALLHGIVW
jgi:hypothetical protein